MFRGALAVLNQRGLKGPPNPTVLWFWFYTHKTINFLGRDNLEQTGIYAYSLMSYYSKMQVAHALPEEPGWRKDEVWLWDGFWSCTSEGSAVILCTALQRIPSRIPHSDTRQLLGKQKCHC